MPQRGRVRLALLRWQIALTPIDDNTLENRSVPHPVEATIERTADGEPRSLILRIGDKKPLRYAHVKPAKIATTPPSPFGSWRGPYTFG